jgi:hypothetical protein
MDGKRTAKRTGERLGTLTTRRYVPRSVFDGDLAWVIEMFDANAVTSLRYPDRCTNPTEPLRDCGIIDRRVREAVLVLIDWTVIAYPCSSFRKHRREEDRETYRGAIWDVDNAKVRSAVGLCRRAYLGY